MTLESKSSLRHRIFRYSVGLVVVVMLLQIALFAAWEFLAEFQGESNNTSAPTYLENEPIAHQLEELIVLGAISALTLPLFMLLIRYVCTRTFQPIENMAQTADQISEGRTDLRIDEQQTEDEIGTLASTLNLAFDRYQELLEEAEQFSADASHQLRTPLAVIRSSGELALSRAQTTEEYRDVLSNILEETARLEHIVEQLLLLTRIGSGAPRQGFTRVKPGGILHEVEDRFGALFEEKDVKLEVADDATPEIEGNAALVTEAVANLAINALQATPAGGTVTLRAFADHDRVTLEVIDTGCGISPDNQKYVFNRFHRVSSDPNSGTGLGLAIVQAIAEAHNATPELESTPEHGSTFRLHFPPATYLQHYEI